MQLLLDVESIDVNLANNEGTTPLMNAVSCYLECGHVIPLLLSADGIDVNARNEEGRTALFIAATYDDPVIIQYLLSAKGLVLARRE